jgi:hypothetical protein
MPFASSKLENIISTSLNDIFGSFAIIGNKKCHRKRPEPQKSSIGILLSNGVRGH